MARLTALADNQSGSTVGLISRWVPSKNVIYLAVVGFVLLVLATTGWAGFSNFVSPFARSAASPSAPPAPVGGRGHLSSPQPADQARSPEETAAIAALLEQLPPWVQIYPGAVVTGGDATNTSKGVGIAVYFNTPASPAEIDQFYQNLARSERFISMPSVPGVFFDRPPASRHFGYTITSSAPSKTDVVLSAQP